MWVKLKTSKVIANKHYGIGDWVEVGTDTAIKWIGLNHAESLPFDSPNLKDCGVVYPPSSKAPKLPFNIQSENGGLKALFPKNLFLNAPYSIADRDSPNLIRNAGRFAVFFDLLNKWDVVLIFGSYEINASKVGQSEHEITQALVHDLRVPYYQSCAWGVKDSEAGRDFLDALTEERARGTVLAPLRALYRVKPMAYYLPPDWGKVADKNMRAYL
jgi:hypothetical protein